MSYVKILYGPVFWDTDHQVATVAMETTQLVLSKFKNFFNSMNWELNKVSVCQK